MPLTQKIFALVVSVLILIVIVELVRRRRLREEYSFLWIITGITLIILSLWYRLLVFITHAIGAVLPTSTLFLFGLLFLVMISLHFSVKISKLTDQLKDVAQEVAILKASLDDRK
ncbi:MAG: DUF2304 domain-containing protein [Candidatus Schekmanbacteria bacterium]|nr:DUF2304 domain-containing protein [Candidatus Schekmanbacteria bacterium]